MTTEPTDDDVDEMSRTVGELWAIVQEHQRQIAAQHAALEQLTAAHRFERERESVTQIDCEGEA